jgi:hypothetical protein
MPDLELLLFELQTTSPLVLWVLLVGGALFIIVTFKYLVLRLKVHALEQLAGYAASFWRNREN